MDGVALLLVENETRAIRALVGATRPSPRVLDATRRPRSAGSTLKPLLYALAFDLGRATPRTRLLDLPWSAPEWTPSNFDAQYRGPVPAGRALSLSLNLPAVRLQASLPSGAFPRLLRRLGFDSVRRAPDVSGLDLALGTDDVTPLQLAAAYCALANGGRYAPLALRGEPVPAVRLLSEGAAGLVSRVLSDPLRPRPLGAPSEGVAWKTGTSSRRRDAWAAGYTRRFTAVVWRGRLDGRPDASLVGARAASPLLFRLLQAADPHPAPFDAPRGVEPVALCAATGLRRGAACPDPTIMGLRPTDAAPLRSCGVHQALRLDSKTGALRCHSCLADHAVHRERFALYPPRWAVWRTARGLPAASLPAHASDCVEPVEPEGTRPLFLAPRDGQRFAARRLRVAVIAQRPCRLLVDGEPAGNCPAVLTLPPGRHRLTVIDRHGRTASVRVTVGARG